MIFEAPGKGVRGPGMIFIDFFTFSIFSSIFLSNFGGPEKERAYYWIFIDFYRFLSIFIDFYRFYRYFIVFRGFWGGV